METATATATATKKTLTIKDFIGKTLLIETEYEQWLLPWGGYTVKWHKEEEEWTINDIRGDVEITSKNGKTWKNQWEKVKLQML